MEIGTIVNITLIVGAIIVLGALEYVRRTAPIKAATLKKIGIIEIWDVTGHCTMTNYLKYEAKFIPNDGGKTIAVRGESTQSSYYGDAVNKLHDKVMGVHTRPVYPH